MNDPRRTYEIAAAEEDEEPGSGEPSTVNPGDVLPEAPDDAAAIDGFLSGFGRGYQVSIVRTAPVWCAGYLTTLPMDHGITLNEIRESYGGRRFQLRILTDSGKYVAMRTVLISDVPRDEGKPITTLDRQHADGARPNPSPPPSGLGDFAGVLRDLLKAQQESSIRQAEMIERLISQPVERATAAIASPLEQIQQLGEVIAAVRELAPTISPAAEGGGGGGGGEDLMLKLAEKLITKFADKKERAPESRQLPPGRAPGGAPGGAPGARRPPMIIRGPRPPGIPAPAPQHAPIVPNPTTIAAMREARAMDATPPPEEIAEEPAAIAEGEPVPNPAAADLENANDSSTPRELAGEEDGDEFTAEEVRDLLLDMPVEDAALVVRDLFDRLGDEDKEKAIAIVAGISEPSESTSNLDNSTRDDP